MMGQSRNRSNDSALLSTTRGTGGDENTSVLAPVSASGPLTSSGIPESLPLSWEVTITGWNAEEECIVTLEGFGIDDWDIGLGGCVHLQKEWMSANLDWKGKDAPWSRPLVGESQGFGRDLPRCQPS
jgi:hypothetical protein